MYAVTVTILAPTASRNDTIRGTPHPLLALSPRGGYVVIVKGMARPISRAQISSLVVRRSFAGLSHGRDVLISVSPAHVRNLRMCGIAGAIDASRDRAAARVRLINDAQQHRGPDHGVLARVSGFALGKTRLAVQDPGPAGNRRIRVG